MANPRYHRLRLRHMLLLELIEEEGSLRAVANRLNMSQPAISAMVRDLEEAFGTELIERSVRGVALNRAGQLALTRSRPSLAFIEQLAEEVEIRDLPVLRVGANPAVMLNPVPKALNRFQSEQIRNRFTFRTGLVGEMVDALTKGEIDCYIGQVDWTRVDADAADMLKCRNLGHSGLSVGCARDHPLLQKEVVRPEDLLSYPWISASEASSNWQAVSAQFRRRGLKPPVPTATAGLIGILSIAADTECLFCGPDWVIDHRITGGTLSRLDVEGFDLTRAAIDFLSLIDPEPGTAMGDWLAALEAEWPVVGVL
ncbi:MAG: LysR family transcriptional regulator [Pseudooceanicola atlanticus]